MPCAVFVAADHTQPGSGCLIDLPGRRWCCYTAQHSKAVFGVVPRLACELFFFFFSLPVIVSVVFPTGPPSSTTTM